MIKLNDIGVCYGNNTVYQNFNFQFDAGVNVVLGKSGCGKTTLLNVIAGLIPHTGSCQKDGEVAFVFQQPCLAPVSVWKNIDAVLPKGDNLKAIQQILEAVDLAEKRNAPVSSLSGGEQQRVSLARAFVTNRPILLLDEPFSNLDYGVKVQLGKIFCGLVDQTKTVVLVTHDIDEALALADRLYLLSNKPCTISQVAEISTPQLKRNQFDEETVSLKKHLQNLLS